MSSGKRPTRSRPPSVVTPPERALPGSRLAQASRGDGVHCEDDGARTTRKIAHI